MKRPVWPRGVPIPSFKSYAEEVKFWHSYDFDSHRRRRDGKRSRALNEAIAA
jgi:hypothetical protein